ncbi:Profilin (actin-binding protein) [Venturia nashicola]|uniref:Profilin n=1 Tax=Venturia nashicola TaxID=86259 RepID=A0A4Z1PNV9_9PEZI|nr:Profilin (actin-binding protein) [Venturia nashicola]TLD37697.1 Profilin (actin-binding protein) [Venturia nashicola]
MSWQAYIDSSLIGTGTVDNAAIFSVNGKDNWARSEDFKISPEEMKVLLDGFADPNPLYGSGFHVDGVKYTVIGATDKTIRGKQVRPSAQTQENTIFASGKNRASESAPRKRADKLSTSQGKNGMIVAKTTQALLFAHHNENVTTQNCVSTVEALQDYLVGVGY